MLGSLMTEGWSRLTGRVYVLGVKRCAVCDAPIAGAVSVCDVCCDRAMRGQFDRMERDYPTSQVGDKSGAIRPARSEFPPMLPSVKNLTP